MIADLDQTAQSPERPRRWALPIVTALSAWGPGPLRRPGVAAGDTRYTVDSVVARGIDARVLSGRSAIEPTILLWTEGIRSYQLYSSTLSAPGLVQIAELLR